MASKNETQDAVTKSEDENKSDAAPEAMNRTVSQASSQHSIKYPDFDMDGSDRPVRGKVNKKTKEPKQKTEKAPKEKKKKDEKPKKEKPPKSDKKKEKEPKNKKDKNKLVKKLEISNPVVTDPSNAPSVEGAKDLKPSGSKTDVSGEPPAKKDKKNKKHEKVKEDKKKEDKVAKKKENEKPKKIKEPKKKNKKEKPKKRGRSKSKDKSKDKPPAKKTKKRDESLASRDTDDVTNSVLDDGQSDITDASSYFSDFTTTDEESSRSKKKSKNKKKTKKKKKKAIEKKNKSDDNKRRGSKSSKDSAIVITDDEGCEDDENPPRYILGCIRVPGKHEPIVYSCCGCCSLGAGSLLTALIFLGLSAGYVAYRAGLLKQALKESFWVFWYAHNGLLENVWRAELIVGIMTASVAGFASLLLLVASCIWGQKEHYKRIRKCISIWLFCVGVAMLNNFAETIYIQAMPVNVKITTITGVEGTKDTDFMKAYIPTLWALTIIYFLFYVYLCIVLYSYLRLLRYMNAPKIGQDTTKQDGDEATTPTSSVAMERRSSSLRANKDNGLSRSTTSLQLSRQSSLNRDEINERRLSDIKNTARSKEQERLKQKSNSRDANKKWDQIYENWAYSSDQESYPSQPITRQNSANSLFIDEKKKTKPKPKPRKTFQEVVADDSEDQELINRMSDVPLPRRRKRPAAKSNSLGSRGDTQPIYENQKDFQRKEVAKKPQPKPAPPKAEKPSTPSVENNESGQTYENLSQFGRVEIETPRMQSSTSDHSSPQHLYDMPPTYTELEQLVKKNSFGGSQSDIKEMARLAEQLQLEQEELDKTGHCDPMKAENLTKMAMTALRLSEKILQDVKAGHGIDSSAPNSANVSRTTSLDERGKEQSEELKAVAKDFFYKLSEDEVKNKVDPMEEMFRLFGKDLVKQNPDNAPNIMRSYLENHQQQSFPNVTNETMPWQTILNPSESQPSGKSFNNSDPSFNIPPPPVSDIGGGFMPMDPNNQNPLNPNLRTQSAFTPTQTFPNPNVQSSVSNHFHPIQPGSKSQSHNPTGNGFTRPLFPVEFPLQNSASYKQENNQFPHNGNASQHHPHQQQQQFSHPMHNHPNFKGREHPRYPPGPNGPHNPHHQFQRHPHYPYQHHHGNPESEDPYMYSECPYSCCYDPYDDYGSVYSMYTGYDDSIYGDYRHRDQRWYPAGMEYSVYGSNYYPQHDGRFWDAPNRPGKEDRQRQHANTMPYPSRPSFRADTAKSPKITKRRDDKRDRKKSSSFKSKSLPDLLDDDLYSDRTSNHSGWNDDSSIGRSSIGSRKKGQSRGGSLSDQRRGSKNDDYLKGYKAALREALISMKSSHSNNDFASVDMGDKFLENFISKSRRNESKHSQFTEDEFAGSRPRRKGKVGARDSKLISFRPSNRPGAQIVGDDLFNDYRTDSLVPSNRAEQDDFFLSRKSSNGTRRGRNDRARSQTDDDWRVDIDFDGNFSQFSRDDSGRPSSRLKKEKPPRHDSFHSRGRRGSFGASSAAASDAEGKPHVYNTLERENVDQIEMEQAKKSRTSSMRSSGSRDNSIGRSRSNDRKSSRNFEEENDVQWFMGEEDEPIYGSEYNGLWTKEPTVERGRPVRRQSENPKRSSSQHVHKDVRSFGNKRATSLESNKRKVTFGRDRF